MTLGLLLIGCSSKTVADKTSRQELIRYVNDKKNGLAKEVNSNGTRVKVSYQPSCLLVASELNQGQENDIDTIKKLENKYRDRYYFLLKFSRNGSEAIRQLGSFSSYSDMVQVLAFQMRSFVNLTTPQKDTLDLEDYFFDQTYGMSDANTILLSFGKEKIKNQKEIEINIGECGFGTGAIKFSFDMDDIRKTPVLEYSLL